MEFGDSGFRGARELGMQIFTLVRQHTSTLYKVHTSHRIKVENVIADLKDFAILKLPIRELITDNHCVLVEHTKNWIIVGGLLNAKKDAWRAILDV